MFLSPVPCPLKHKIKIRYDCCGLEAEVQYRTALRVMEKHNGKHICHPCYLKYRNPTYQPESREKRIQTMLEKYGPDYQAVLDERRKETLLEKYGTDQIPKEST